MQQTLSDLLSQIDAAQRGTWTILANEQQSGQRLLEAVRLEGQRLLSRQEAADSRSRAGGRMPCIEAQTMRRTFALKRPLCGLKSLRKFEDREIIIEAIGTFGATVAESGQVLINGEPITPEVAVATLQAHFGAGTGSP